MKQKNTILFAIGILALVTSTTNIFASNVTNSTERSHYQEEKQTPKKVIISGNVEVQLVQDPESRKLYTNDGTAKVSVYTVDNVIYVATKKNSETAKITLYVNNIYRIDVSDHAVVTTKNTLNLQYLQIILKDHAKAIISSKTQSLYTKLINESALQLNGATGNLAVSTNELATLNMNNFKAIVTEVEKRNTNYSFLK